MGVVLNTVDIVVDGFDSHLYSHRRLEDWMGGLGTHKTRRNFNLAVRGRLNDLYDDFAASKNWHALWNQGQRMLLNARDGLVWIDSGQKKGYTSNSFTIETISPARAKELRQQIEEVIGDRRITELMFSIDWHFVGVQGRISSVTMEEIADDVLYDESYPDLGGVSKFVKAYIAAPETILVLQGPPGTGKTRLIRAIMAELSRETGEQASALYTAERAVLERDELFVSFISGDDHAFIMEDADHLLLPRAKGNEHLHRFLAIADGVVRAQGRKIIFSTNLPNITDLDDALVRPGRCYARIATRNLSPQEAWLVIHRLTEDKVERTAAEFALSGMKSISLAHIYKAVADAKA